MKMGCGRQMSETFLLGSLLAGAGGFLDAYTYLARGGVFANAQTGNIVLLGIHLAKAEWGRAIYYVLPILAFILGIFSTEAIRHLFRKHSRLHWRQIVAAFEITVVLIAAFLPMGALDMLVNIAVSFVCAMQVEAFRKLYGNPYATTMCTGNLRSASEALYRFLFFRENAQLRKSLQYFGIILCFIIGAALGGWLTAAFSGKAILFATLPLFAACGLMCLH